MNLTRFERLGPALATIAAAGMVSIAQPAKPDAVHELAWTDARAVTRGQIARAMRQEKQKGYDIAVTANGVRLQVGIVLDLVREADAVDPERRPLRINHEDYYDAFLEVQGIRSDQAPIFIRAAHENKEDQIIDYRLERVIGRVVKGGEPRYAMNVLAGWPAGAGGRSTYSYEDETSEPELRVTHDRKNFYRIVEFKDDVILYDDIRGIRGRATSGALGVMFAVIGDGRAVRTRLMFSADGVQVSRTTARKIFSITQTVTVLPNGRVQKDVPKDRPDLQKIAARLEQPIEIDYRPVELVTMPPRTAVSPGDPR